MGYNTGIVYVHARRDEVIAALGNYEEATDPDTSWDVASSSSRGERLGIGQIGEWVEIWDPSQELSTSRKAEATRKALSRIGRALCITMASVVDTYQFRVYEKGSVVRSVTWKGREVEEEGDPLPEEDEEIEMPSWGYDEGACFEIVRRVTGIGWKERDRAVYRTLERDK